MSNETTTPRGDYETTYECLPKYAQFYASDGQFYVKLGGNLAGVPATVDREPHDQFGERYEEIDGETYIVREIPSKAAVSCDEMPYLGKEAANLNAIETYLEGNVAAHQKELDSFAEHFALNPAQAFEMAGKNTIAAAARQRASQQLLAFVEARKTSEQYREDDEPAFDLISTIIKYVNQRQEVTIRSLSATSSDPVTNLVATGDTLAWHHIGNYVLELALR